MARVTHVKKARKDQGNCLYCGKKIVAGDAYKHVTLKTGPRSSQRKVACDKCRFRGSDLTTSEIRIGVLSVQENAEDELNALATTIPSDDTECDDFLSSLETIRDTAAEEAREQSDMIEGKASNIEDGFGHATSQSEEIRERAENVSSWADELEAVELGPYDPDEFEDDDPLTIETWASDQIDALMEAISSCPE